MSTTTTAQSDDDDIQIRVIRPEDRQSVLDFIRIHYYTEEPLTCGHEPKQQEKADEDFHLSHIEHGTSLMAVHTESNSIVGVLLAGPKGPDEVELLLKAAAEEGPTKWGVTLRFLAEVERGADVCRRFGVTKVLHAHLISVSPQVRGRHICVRLMIELRSMGKKLNYELVTGDCTNYYSAEVFERVGVECVYTIYYKDYLDENKEPVFKPNKPHEFCKSFAIRT